MTEDLFANLRLTVHETARGALMCFGCGKLTAFDGDAPEVVPLALRGQPPRCTACGGPIDVWKNSVLALTAGENGLAMAAQLGARHTAVLYPLRVGEMASFDVREKGVPSDAQLLRVTHRSALAEGTAIVDLDATDSSRRPGFVVRVLGVRLEGAAEDMQAQTTITWAPHDDDDEGRRSLNRALLAVADGRLEDAIVPANVAVEVTLNRVLSEHLGRVGIGRERRRDFMSNAATYSHQLNILLPVVLAGRGAPAMPEHIRGLLNRLRDLRNDIGHRGLPRTPLTREVVGECLAGAVFGFHFVRLSDEVLAGTPPK